MDDAALRASPPPPPPPTRRPVRLAAVLGACAIIALASALLALASAGWPRALASGLTIPLAAVLGQRFWDRMHRLPTRALDTEDTAHEGERERHHSG